MAEAEDRDVDRVAILLDLAAIAYVLHADTKNLIQGAFLA
jgi:hypothetical protein